MAAEEAAAAAAPAAEEPAAPAPAAGDDPDVWKRFSPAEHDSRKCMARVWAGGVGGQCQRNHQDRSEFCILHNKKEAWRTHGRVDGPIPETKLAQFLSVKANATTTPKKKKERVSDLAPSPEGPEGEKKQRSQKKETASELVPAGPEGEKKRRSKRFLRRGTKKTKDPNRPKIPAGGAYGVFYKENRASIAATLPAGHKMTDVAKAASAQYKALSDDEKKPYQDTYEEKMSDYKKSIAEYKAANPETPSVQRDPASEKPKQLAGGAYGVFMKQNRASIVASLPSGHKLTEVTKAASAQWKALPEAEKQPYKDQFSEKSLELKKNLRDYNLKAVQEGRATTFGRPVRRKRKRAW